MLRLDENKVREVWEEAREAFYESKYLDMVSMAHFEGKATCFHPPLKADGTHNKQFKCSPCDKVANDHYKQARYLDMRWSGVWEAFERMGLPVDGAR